MTQKLLVFLLSSILLVLLLFLFTLSVDSPGIRENIAGAVKVDCKSESEIHEQPVASFAPVTEPVVGNANDNDGNDNDSSNNNNNHNSNNPFKPPPPHIGCDKVHPGICTGQWIGNTYVPSTGRLYSTSEIASIFKDRCVLVLGDSLGRRLATSLAIMLKEEHSGNDEDVGWKPFKDPTALGYGGHARWDHEVANKVSRRFH